jgi:hypothetical protein
MDDLYGNAWGDPLNDYSNQPLPLPTWNTQPSSPKQPPPVEDDRNDNHANDDGNEGISTETQFHADASGASWTADAVPWPVEENHDPYHSAWMPVSPANVWSLTAQPHTPNDDASPNAPSPASPTLPEEPKEEHSSSSEEAKDTPIQSRASTPDQFGTFESGGTNATIPAEEVGWGSSEYSTFDDSVGSSNAWDRPATAKELDTEPKPVDEWEAARRMKEKLDRRVVCVDPHSFDSGNLLSVRFSLRKLLRVSLKPLRNSLRKCGQKAHRLVQALKRNGFRAGDVVLIASKACT